MPNEYLIALHEELAEAEQNLADARENTARAEQLVTRIKNAIERWEGPDKGRRRHLRRIWTIPAALGAAAELAKKITHTPQTAALGGSLLLAAAAITYAVIQTPHPHSRPHAAPPHPRISTPTGAPRSPRPSPRMRSTTMAPTGPRPPVGSAPMPTLPDAPMPISSSTTIRSAPTATPLPSMSIPSVRTRRCLVIDLGELVDVRASIQLLERGRFCVHPPLR